jgi:hypothetical protein
MDATSLVLSRNNLLSMDELKDAVFALGPHIRYVAYGRGQSVELSQREGVLHASAASSDFFEELLVNPTLLTIARQRGNLDCGGLRHVIVGYGNFNQVILQTHEGHLSVCVEVDHDPVQVAVQLADMLEGRS